MAFWFLLNRTTRVGRSALIGSRFPSSGRIMPSQVSICRPAGISSSGAIDPPRSGSALPSPSFVALPLGSGSRQARCDAERSGPEPVSYNKCEPFPIYVGLRLTSSLPTTCRYVVAASWRVFCFPLLTFFQQVRESRDIINNERLARALLSIQGGEVRVQGSCDRRRGKRCVSF